MQTGLKFKQSLSRNLNAKVNAKLKENLPQKASKDFSFFKLPENIVHPQRSAEALLYLQITEQKQRTLQKRVSQMQNQRQKLIQMDKKSMQLFEKSRLRGDLLQHQLKNFIWHSRKILFRAVQIYNEQIVLQNLMSARFESGQVISSTYLDRFKNIAAKCSTSCKEAELFLKQASECQIQQHQYFQQFNTQLPSAELFKQIHDLNISNIYLNKAVQQLKSLSTNQNKQGQTLNEQLKLLRYQLDRIYRQNQNLRASKKSSQSQYKVFDLLKEINVCKEDLERTKQQKQYLSTELRRHIQSSKFFQSENVVLIGKNSQLTRRIDELQAKLLLAQEAFQAKSNCGHHAYIKKLQEQLKERTVVNSYNRSRPNSKQMQQGLNQTCRRLVKSPELLFNRKFRQSLGNQVIFVLNSDKTKQIWNIFEDLYLLWQQSKPNIKEQIKVELIEYVEKRTNNLLGVRELDEEGMSSVRDQENFTQNNSETCQEFEVEECDV